MTDWLAPLRETLDRVPSERLFFFRVDDAGWCDEGLRRLLDEFAEARIPVDVAVIPAALGRDLARELIARSRIQTLGLHQHGFAHTNHEPDGRKCEFGRRRELEDQRRDLEEGRDRLRDALGNACDPIFTPPWNRCSPETAVLLSDLGFRMLSRDETAGRVDSPPLIELPITVDWFAHRKGVRLTRNELGEKIAESASLERPTGIMLHHAVMDGDDREGVRALLRLVGDHPRARCVRMGQAVELAPQGGLRSTSSESTRRSCPG